ncbi:MAG: D-arabinono-1,4-lactone oxidase [Euzebya sp.]
MNVQDSRHSTLQEVMEAMAVAEDGEHLAAWIDLAHRGGRGILTRSTFATSPDGLDLDDRRRRAVPPKLPRLVTPLTVRAFGAAKYARSRPDLHRMPVWDALFPLDRVEGWEAAYGPAGMVQYQFVSPTPDPILEAVDAITQQPVPAFLGVLKRLGTESGGMLSFPMPGWTLAVDFPADPRLRQLFEQLDEFVVNAGGRVYLAKDGRLSQATFAQMYPRVQEWKSVRDELDPAGQFQSDLGRRLGLTDREGTSNA